MSEFLDPRFTVQMLNWGRTDRVGLAPSMLGALDSWGPEVALRLLETPVEELQAQSRAREQAADRAREERVARWNAHADALLGRSRPATTTASRPAAAPSSPTMSFTHADRATAGEYFRMRSNQLFYFEGQWSARNFPQVIHRGDLVGQEFDRDPMKTAAALGIRVIDTGGPLPDDPDLLGKYAASSRTITLYNSDRPAWDRLVTLAHELGHAIEDHASRNAPRGCLRAAELEQAADAWAWGFCDGGPHR